MDMSISKLKNFVFASFLALLTAAAIFVPANAEASTLEVGEEMEQVQFTQEEIDELTIVDDPEDIGSLAVLNINAAIPSGYRAVYGTTVRKVSGTTVSWNINWTSSGTARIGVLGANGTFYYLTDSGESSIRTARISLTQNYRFAISNRSGVNATFAGWRDL